MGGGRGGNRAVADEITRRVRSLAEPLKSALISVEANTVTLTVPTDKRKIFEIKKAQIEEVLEGCFKRKMKLALKDGVETGEKKNVADPLLKEAVKIFGARVVEDTGRFR